MMNINNLPKITIITPTYNHSIFIERTIQSVLGQKYPNLEYIIMDGGSTDGTLEIVKKYAEQIILITEKDRGMYNAINKGMNIAKGDIIGYINSDDIYEPGALLRVGKYFLENPTVCWLSGKCKIIDINDKEINRAISMYRNILLQYNNRYNTLLVVDYIPQPSTFWRKEFSNKIGKFNEEYNYVSDYDYWLRAMKLFQLHVIKDNLSSFRTYPTSKTQKRVLNNDNEELIMIKKYTTSKVIRGLYMFHRMIIEIIYKLLSK
jgi:glycosyltransferase involved in cell wall biosynthesis